jgi:RND family efflux transporter MFP subunit
VLFRIDPEPFVAARDAAQASVASAEAQARLADTTAQRMESSAQQGAISEVQALEARAQADVAEAQVDVAREQLKIKELDVTYTNVVAPISGRAMASNPTVGSLVGTVGSEPLTTIYDDSRIQVWFTAPDGADQGQPAYPEVDMATDIDTGFPYRGQVDYIDPAVDVQTGTVRVRAVFDNPEMRLTDGLFVRVRVAAQTLAGATVVPETAIGQDQIGRYVYVVDEQDLCQRRNVAVGPVSGPGRVILSGLAGDERVIVKGLLKVRPGAPVTATSAASPPAGS